jgi:hypothetical protein
VQIHLAALTHSAAIEYAQTSQGGIGAASQFRTGWSEGVNPVPAADLFGVVGGQEVDQPSREVADYAGSGVMLANFPTLLCRHS